MKIYIITIEETCVAEGCASRKENVYFQCREKADLYMSGFKKANQRSYSISIREVETFD